MSKINATPVWDGTLEKQLVELKAQKNAAVRDRLAVREALADIMQLPTGALLCITQAPIAERIIQALLPYTTEAFQTRLLCRTQDAHAIPREARAAMLDEVDKALQPLLGLVERATTPWLSGEEHHESLARIRSARAALADALAKAKADMASLRKTATPPPPMPATERKVVGVVGGVEFQDLESLHAAEQLAIRIVQTTHTARRQGDTHVTHCISPLTPLIVRQAMRGVAAEVARTTGLTVEIV